MSQSKIPEDQLVEWLRTALPDGVYFLSLFKRHRYFIISMLVITIASAFVGYYKVKNKYSSDTSVVIKADNRTVVSRVLEPINVREHIDSFSMMTKSQKFLGEVYERMLREGIIKDNSLELESLVALAKKQIKIFLIKLQGGEFDAENEKYGNKFRAIDSLSQAFVAYASETGVLTIEAFFDSPDKAQRITQLIMNHFIVTELESEVAYLERKSQSLKSNMALAKSNYSQVKEGLKSTLSREEEELSSRRESELELTERVRELTGEINSLNLEKTRSRLSLEAEYKRLSTMLQPDHPTLVAKRKEIMAVSPDDIVSTKEKLRDDLKNRLRDVRRKSNAKDSLVESGLGDAAFNLNLLTNGLNDIEIEKEKIIKDLMNPEQSTIFRTIKPPALNIKPYINAKAKVSVGIGLVGMFILFLGLLIMEFFSEKAQDAWRIRKISGKEIIAKLPRVLIDDVKGEKEILKQWVRGKVSPKIVKKGYIKGILENRAFEISLIENCVGKTILLTQMTDVSLCSHHLKNFLNIFAKDQTQSAMVIDFNFVSPLISLESTKNLSRESIKSGSRAVGSHDNHFYPHLAAISGNKLNNHFDYIPVHESEAGFDFLGQSSDSNIFDLYRKTYEWIFVLGFPASFSVENRKLQKYVTDTIVFLDCETTQYAVLKRLMIDLEQANIRGIAMLESAA